MKTSSLILPCFIACVGVCVTVLAVPLALDPALLLHAPRLSLWPSTHAVTHNLGSTQCVQHQAALVLTSCG
eukprot:3103904-Rhodomonas_salina.1